MTIKEIDKKIKATYKEWDEKKKDYRSHLPVENRSAGEKYRGKIQALFEEKRALLSDKEYHTENIRPKLVNMKL